MPNAILVTTATERQQAEQRHGSCRWVHRWAPPSAKHPAGGTGGLRITSFTRKGPVEHLYMVECVLDRGRIVGWVLINLDNGQEYQLNPEWGAGQWECTCGDHVFRQKECKHSKALQAALREIGALKKISHV